MRSRDAVLDCLRSGVVPDVLIVGAGINGVGVYRDLALQGIPALMVDRGDICSGASAAPSRLIHGGLRYLEIGEFALVKESVEERNRLLLDAPHYVRPLSVWVPIETLTGGAIASIGRFLRLISVPGSKGALVVKLGLMVYDLFGRTDRTMPRHRMVPAREFRQAMPDLAPSTRYIAEFYDARITAPERLGLELVADAEDASPSSLAVTYLAVAGRDGGRVVLEDKLTGERFSVSPKLVVNCAGAWLDQTDRCLGVDAKLIGGTKGSHLVLRNRDLAEKLGDRMIYFETPDHRICLAYQLDAEHVLLGTTDIRTDDPDDTICTSAEIDYLFKVMHIVMPGLELTVDQIVFTYAGVRPLPASDGVAGAISRDHSIRRYERGEGRPYPILALVGGKWTTFRACAAEIVDDIVARLGRARRISTAGIAIGGGKGFPVTPRPRRALAAELAARYRLTQARAEVLLDRYGTWAESMMMRLAAAGDVALAALPDYSRIEIASICREERVATLSDLILRRTQIALLGRASPALISELAEIAGDVLEWSSERIAAEVAQTTQLLATRHGVPGKQE